MDYQKVANQEMTVDEFMAGLEAAREAIQPTINLMVESLAVESERGMALAGAAFLDEALDGLLKAYFQFSVGYTGFPDGGRHQTILKEFAGPSGPLGTFANRAKMAYMLNLIKSDTLKDLLTIGKIRNKFAHILRISSFGDTEVVDLANNLQTSDDGSASGFKTHPHRQSQTQFLTSVGSIGMTLLAYALLQERGFPIHELSL
jgi:DNA-binding MltR family transcriptional regulator